MVWLVLLAPGVFLLVAILLARVEQCLFGEPGMAADSGGPTPEQVGQAGVHVDEELCSRVAGVLGVSSRDEAVDIALRLFVMSYGHQGPQRASRGNPSPPATRRAALAARRTFRIARTA